MPAACSPEKIASREITPKSSGPVAKLNKNSVGIPNIEGFVAVVSVSLLFKGDDMI
jgi:hypothetical protein